jgi:cellulose synthase/poly-beta-1,6-N-acetylglucosamine synthase-like glycosyltransferase
VTLGAALFWVTSLLLVWVYVGYPAAAAVAGRMRPIRLGSKVGPPPLVTVGIAAHDEARQLEDRVANVLEQAGEFELELIVASDGSTDATSELMARLAALDPRVRFLDLDRAGQTAAQAEIFEAARGDIVVLSDAETRFAPACLARLVAPLADPRVGCTTGQLVWRAEDRTQTSRNEGVYWRYEQVVRRLESRAGWLTAVTGALLAVRRTSYRPVPAHASMDHLLPLHVRDQGLLVLAVPDAVGADRPISGLAEQFRNRARTATRGIRANLSMAGRLAPWRRPSAALAIWSHKLLRWATPWLAALALAGAALEVAAGRTAYAVPLLAAGVVGVLAVIGWLARRARADPPRAAAFALSVVVVNVAFLVGWLNVLRGRRIEAWHREDWDPSPGAGSKRQWTGAPRVSRASGAPTTGSSPTKPRVE